jgi:methionyl-tRNA formyltransferase
LRIVFLGAGPLALPVFQGLLDSAHEVVGLVTQPDKSGAGHHRHVNPLKVLAEERGLPVLQPEKISAPEAVAEVTVLAPDVGVVAAYGQMLSQKVLDLPPHGMLNVHASLLPLYRGATPIHAAVLNGDAESGVTIIRLVKQLDAGPILGMVSTPIGSDETTGELESRLGPLAVPLLLSVLDDIATGKSVPVEQDHAQASHVGKLRKEDGLIDWNRSATAVECHIRGMQPWPGPFTFLHQTGKPPLRLKVLKARPLPATESVAPGDVVEVLSDGFRIQCGDGSVVVESVQPDAKRAMASAEFLRGRQVNVGDRCGANL